MRSQDKTKTKSKGRRGGKSEYGRQMLEKQKARYSYGVASGQFSKYVKIALQTTGDNAQNLLRILEGRLDNVVLRAGLAPSRSAARQMVSHGHITVNGKRVTIPSYEVSVGDKLAIREGSKKKGIFSRLDEEMKTVKVPAWMSVDPGTREISIEGEPSTDASELLFDVKSVLEFYTR
jgi:small subunit ribosomal protein S4